MHGDALFEAINTSGLSLIPDSNLASNSTGRLPIGSVRLYLREGRRNSEDPNETLKAVHIAKVFADAIDIQRRLAAVPLTSNPTTNQQPPTDRQVANDARNYHALRLVGAILDELAETGLQPCGLQRRGNQDADLWTLVSAENPAEALLLRPDKHLNKRQRETFFALPEAPLRS